jgi:hypothetical protein
MAKIQGKALWYVGPGRAELQEEAIAAPKPGEVQVRALFGAISRGTERLVHAGRVPASEYGRMRAPFMGGTFPFPVKYGYATVGRVEAGAAELRQRIVFSLHPHQSLFTLSAQSVLPIPEDVPPARAVLAANMETASTRCGMACLARPTASLSWAGGSLAFWLRIYARACRERR